MKIAAFVHYYIPHRNAGSETMLHAMLARLVKDGHEVVAFVTDNPAPNGLYERDGVQVANLENFVIAQPIIEQFAPDLIITHHDNAMRAARLSKKLSCPFVFIVHNDFESNERLLDLNPDLTVFNTRWINRKWASKVQRSVVIHPPVWADQHWSPRGNAVTLVNLNESKGAGLLYWLARNMPDVEFIGVEGGHGIQIFRDEFPNVSFVRQTDNMRDDVWARTRILLMPSLYESYGMAGVEALASGIPVIANPTPGLLESLSYGGLFVAREDGQGWIDAIDSLADPDTYSAASALAFKRSEELNPGIELDEFAELIRSL